MHRFTVTAILFRLKTSYLIVDIETGIFPDRISLANISKRFFQVTSTLTWSGGSPKRGLNRRTQSFRLRSKAKDSTKDKMMVPETDLESIHKEAQDVASLDVDNPRGLLIQLQKFIVKSNVVDFRSEMCELSTNSLQYTRVKTGSWKL